MRCVYLCVHYGSACVCVWKGKRETKVGSPAMDHNGSVSGPPLYHQHLLNDVNDGTGGGAQTLRGPAGHLELGHLVHLARLQDQRQEVRE